jgi:hypothetical protein
MRLAGNVARIGMKMSPNKFYFGGGSLKERNHYENLHLCGRIILNWILKKQGEGKDLIRLAQDRGQGMGLTNTTLDLRIPQNDNFLCG